MKYLKKFNTVSDEQAYFASDKYQEPYVSLVNDSKTNFNLSTVFTYAGGGVKKMHKESIDYGDVPDNVTEVKISQYVRYINEQAFIDCTLLTGITIPDGVESIGDDVFTGCTSLKTVVMGDSVEEISSNCFEQCTKLENVKLSNNLSFINEYVFSHCSSLKSITLPENLEQINNNAFQYCTSLNNLVIPSSVTSIGSEAFKGCTSLSSITYNGTMDAFQKAVSDSADWAKDVPAKVVHCIASAVDFWIKQS